MEIVRDLARAEIRRTRRLMVDAWLRWVEEWNTPAHITLPTSIQDNYVLPEFVDAVMNYRTALSQYEKVRKG